MHMRNCTGMKAIYRGGREIGCNYALAMGAYRENLKYRVYNQYKMV